MISDDHISVPAAAELGMRPNRGVFSQVWLFGMHSLRRIFSQPATAAQTFFFPVLTLVGFYLVLGSTVTRANQIEGSGMPSIYGYAALVCLIGSMGGAAVSAHRMQQEARSGLLTRFWTMPLNRGADLAGRLGADAFQMLITVLTVVFAALLMGFEFRGGFGTGIIFVLLPTLFAVGYTLLLLALAGLSGDNRFSDIQGIVTLLLMLFNTGFVPVFAYPGWLQPIVANQPLSCIIDAMNSLSYDGKFTFSFLKAGAWIVGVLAIALPLAIFAYRKVAQRGSQE